MPAGSRSQRLRDCRRRCSRGREQQPIVAVPYPLGETGAVVERAAAEHLRPRAQLDVDLEADDRLVHDVVHAPAPCRAGEASVPRTPFVTTIDRCEPGTGPPVVHMIEFVECAGFEDTPPALPVVLTLAVPVSCAAGNAVKLAPLPLNNPALIVPVPLVES